MKLLLKKLRTELKEIKSLEHAFDQTFSITETREKQLEEQIVAIPDEIIAAHDNQFTETTAIRGRSSRKKVKASKRTNHPMMLEPCSEKCPRQCCCKSEACRKTISDEYWEKDVKSQREFIVQRVSQIPKAREIPVAEKKKEKAEEKKTKRKWSRVYSLKSYKGEVIQVCCNFFHHTIGYKNSHITDWVFNNLEEKALEDRRGSHEPPLKWSVTNKNRIKSHIESFHPAVSHYR